MRVPLVIQSFAAVLSVGTASQAAPSYVMPGYPGSSIRAMAVGVDGSVYVAGAVESTNVNATAVFGNPSSGSSSTITSVLIMKLDRSSLTPIYTVLLGGSQLDQAEAIAVDPEGNVYVAGTTSSPDFPTVNPFQSQPGNATDGSGDGFLVKLNAAGDALLYSTYLGGDDVEEVAALVVDAQRRAVILGTTLSANFPTQNPLFLQPPDPIFSSVANRNLFLARFAPDGSALDMATYIRGDADDVAGDLVVYPNGDLLLTGTTSSGDFPTVNAFEPQLNQGAVPFPLTPIVPTDAFLMRIAADGSNVVYSTYLGDAGFQSGHRLAVDLSGNVLVFGLNTGAGPGTPVAPGSILPKTPPPPGLAFISKMSADGQHLLNRTHFFSVPATAFLDVLGFTADGGGGACFSGQFMEGWTAAGTPGSTALFQGRISADDQVAIVPYPVCEPTEFHAMTLDNEGRPLLAGHVFEPSDRPLIGGEELGPRHAAVLFDLEVKPSEEAAAPVIALADPVNHEIIGCGQPISLRPIAPGSTAPLETVAYFSGIELIGASSEPPYTLIWTNAPLGQHTLTCRASDSLGRNTVSCPINITVVEAPPNDAFMNSTSVLTLGAWLTASTDGASIEPWEPPFNWPAGSVWWCWTSFTNASVRFSLQASNNIAWLQIYTGASLSTLSRQPSGLYTTGAPAQSDSSVTLRVSAGETYFIAVGTVINQGDVSIKVEPVQSPINDDYENRLIVVGDTFGGPILDATYLAPEPNLNFAQGNSAPVWWMWTAPSSGRYRLESGDVPAGVYQWDAFGYFLEIAAWGSFETAPQSLTFVAEGGAQYEIALFNLNNMFPSAAGTLTYLSPPPNDYFSNRVDLGTFPFAIVGNVNGATGEPNEPYTSLNQASSVWWIWTPAESGYYRLSTEGSNFPASVWVYQGDALSNLTLLARSSAVQSWSELSFYGQAGLAYVFRLDKALGFSATATGGDFNLALLPTTAPSNDNFSNRALLTGDQWVIEGSTVGATIEPGEPDTLVGTASLWWTWTVPFDGTYFLTSAAHRVTAYAGEELIHLIKLAPLSNSFSIGNTLLLDGTAGEVIQLAIQGNEGPFQIALVHLNAPANDAHAQRAVLSGDTGPVMADNRAATAEPGEPAHNGDAPHASLWWDWTASSDGAVTVEWLTSTSGRRGPSATEVLTLTFYSGTSLDALTKVLQIHGGYTAHTFHAVSGQTFTVAFDSNLDTRGLRAFQIRPATPPPNDQFANRTPLEGQQVITPGTTKDATLEPGEPGADALAQGHSIWWTWMAPFHGLFNVHAVQANVISLNGFFLGQPVSVYSGSDLTQLVKVSVSPSIGLYQVDAVAGETYAVRLDAIPGDYVLTIQPASWNPATDPTPLRILALAQNERSEWQVTFQGPRRQTNVLDASSNLLEWLPVATNFNYDRESHVADPFLGLPARFYRLRHP